MQFDAVIAFFLLGALSVLLQARIPFPKGLYASISMLLMLAIGLKGGIALQSYASWSLLSEALLVISMGLTLPLVAYPLLRFFGELRTSDAASIAAHYGSVSVGTYAVAVALLDMNGIAYEAYFPLFVVMLEMPAIFIGIWLAKLKSKDMSSVSMDKEIFINPSILLMVGGMIIGWGAGDSVVKIMPLFGELFYGLLALFLLEMGMVAATHLRTLRKDGAFLVSFGVLMPLIGGSAGLLVASILEFSIGGTALLATLGASASYIAVPAAMRSCLPDANPGLSIGASLGVTFPFNVVVGVPLFISTSMWLAA